MEYINLKNNYTKDEILKVSEIIKNGGVVILPTDTVYALAADALNEEAVKRIYKIKKRDLSKPCNILVSNINMIRKVAKRVSYIEEKIMQKFFPGALTIIFEKNNVIPDIVTANLNTIGIRMPDNKFLIELINLVGRPIVATSLNLAGEESKIEIEDISKEFTRNVDCIVNEGKTNIGVASTIIRVNKEKIEVLREGPISKNEIQEVIEQTK